MPTISVAGARGGHGTTTVAVSLALLASQRMATVLRTHDLGAAASLLGVAPSGSGSIEVSSSLRVEDEATEPTESGLVVVDEGVCGDGSLASQRFLVLRGPCYVALASVLARAALRFDGIILVEEQHRSLDGRDVSDVLDLPIVATVPVSPAVARSIDAGLLTTRIHRHREFDQLSLLLRQRTSRRASDPSPRQPQSQPLPNDTDLPLSQLR
jgi:hypothetical protein